MISGPRDTIHACITIPPHVINTLIYYLGSTFTTLESAAISSRVTIGRVSRSSTKSTLHPSTEKAQRSAGVQFQPLQPSGMTSPYQKLTSSVMSVASNQRTQWPETPCRSEATVIHHSAGLHMQSFRRPLNKRSFAKIWLSTLGCVCFGAQPIRRHQQHMRLRRFSFPWLVKISPRLFSSDSRSMKWKVARTTA
jgi:hypothetical protein